MTWGPCACKFCHFYTIVQTWKRFRCYWCTRINVNRFYVDPKISPDYYLG